MKTFEIEFLRIEINRTDKAHLTAKSEERAIRNFYEVYGERAVQILNVAEI